jgi:hypothetical protein
VCLPREPSQAFTSDGAAGEWRRDDKFISAAPVDLDHEMEWKSTPCYKGFFKTTRLIDSLCHVLRVPAATTIIASVEKKIIILKEV